MKKVKHNALTFVAYRENAPIQRVEYQIKYSDIRSRKIVVKFD